MSETAKLVPEAEGIWSLQGELKMMPGFVFPVASHVIRRGDGTLMIHSPIGFSDKQVAAIKQLGKVSVLFCPNLYHTSFLADAQSKFPQARLVGPAGLEKKKRKLPVSELVGPETCSAWGEDFEHVFVGGAPKFNEVILLHKSTRSLFVADYFFNIHEVKGILTKFVLDKVSKTLGKAEQSNLWKKATQDRGAFRKSAERVLELDFSRIYVCHGNRIDDGRAVAERSLAPLLG